MLCLSPVGEFTTQQKYECLVDKLFDPSRYSSLVRPVRNMSETLEVQFSVQLSQIVNLVSFSYVFTNI